MEVVVAIGIILMVGTILTTLFRPTITVKHKVLKGEPRASLFYTDEKGGKLLVAKSLGLRGKPDFIFKKWITNRYIPFEIKSGQIKEDNPHLGDKMQLVAYFLIIEELYGKRPPYGRLIYKNKSFKIRNTWVLRRELKNTLEEMRQMLEGKTHVAAEPSFMKCKNCVCQQTVCEWIEEGKK